uniref:hypothetical protein n=1 Tax=Alistipes indistinctus TaxID=626932 RepID=UPI004029AD66
PHKIRTKRPIPAVKRTPKRFSVSRLESLADFYYFYKTGSFKKPQGRGRQGQLDFATDETEPPEPT